MEKLNFFIFVVLILIMGLLMSGCSSHDNSTKQQYNIKTTVVKGRGEIEKEPAGPYPPKTKVTLTAKPSEGWKFDKWDGSLTGKDPIQTIVVDSKIVVKAKFINVPTIYDLKVKKNYEKKATLNFKVKENEEKVKKVIIDWGDGNSSKVIEEGNIKSKEINESHIYKKEGEYKIEIIAVNTSGKRIVKRKEINIDAEVKGNYQTLKGYLFQEGTGTVSMLIFKAKDGNNYLISGDEEMTSTLQDLKGLPLLLTGKVTNEEGVFKIGPGGEEVKLYSGKLEVKMYNTYYDEENSEVAILGTLYEGIKGLVLLTPNQHVIHLDPDTYHSLDEYIGQEVVINGELEKIDEYQGQIKVKSFVIISNSAEEGKIKGTSIEPGTKGGYQTLKGELIEEGTGTISMLIFDTKSGKDYLVKRVQNDILSQLRGFPLIITGEVTIKEKESTEVRSYDGELEVELYNTYYEEENSEVAILGTLYREAKGLVLLTPNQQIIHLDFNTYHSLDKYVEKKVVITGSLEKESKYKGLMKVKSYKLIE